MPIIKVRNYAGDRNIMLDAFLIKRIQEEKQRNRQERPSMEVEMPDRRHPTKSQDSKSDSKRGITIIDFSI